MKTNSRTQTRLGRMLGPIFSALAVAGISLALWLGLERQQNQQIRDATNLAATAAAREFTKSLEFRGRGLAALAEYWRRSDLSDPARHAESDLYLAQYPYCELVAWVDAQDRVRWVQPHTEGVPDWLPQIVAAGSLLPSPGQQWRARTPIAHRFVISTTASNRGVADGAVVAVFDAERFANVVLQNVNPNYQLHIAIDGREFYDRSDGTPRREQWGQTVVSTDPANHWVVTAWPGESALARQASDLPAVVLVVGLLLAALLSVAVYLGRVSAQNAEQLAAVNRELEDQVGRRKRLEQQLRDQQFYTRSLIEASIDAMMTTDRAGTITDVNEQMEALTGHSRSELIGTPFKTFFTEPERAQEGIELVLHAGRVTDYELTARSKRGHETVVSYNATTFKDRSGVLQGVFAAARDITERKRAERELERSNRELQDFASIASHDLQEPLRKITAFGERLRGHCAAQLDATGLDYLQRMENAAERMAELIERLLEYSRVSTRAHPFAQVDLQGILFEVITDLEPRIRSSGARIIARPMPWLEADRTQIRELLQNLIANALKFHAPGTRPEVEVETHRDGPWQKIIVRDHGIGFDESYVERIFRSAPSRPR